MTPQISPQIPSHFEQNYQRLLNCLKLGGMQPKTIELYSHGVRRAGAYFDYRIDGLSKPQLTDYFVHIIDTLSWSSLIPSGNGHDNPAASAALVYLEITPTDSFKLAAICRKLKLASNLRRKTSLILRMELLTAGITPPKLRDVPAFTG